MEIFLDCLPCMLKQVLEAARMATNDITIQDKILIEATGVLSNYKNYCCSPDLALAMHQIVKKHTLCQDPYSLIKSRDIKGAKNIYPFLKSFLEQRSDDLYWALKIAATGNIIDSAIYNNIDIEGCTISELKKDFRFCDIANFERKLKKAKTLLILGDNSGETVFDRILAEHLAPYNLKIIYAVRNQPIINDATLKEAYESGLDDCTTILSSGSDAPGTILQNCNNDFLYLFYQADLIISKGQGNYESLSDCKRNIFFLLKAKCPVIAKKLGVALNEYVFKEI